MNSTHAMFCRILKYSNGVALLGMILWTLDQNIDGKDLSPEEDRYQSQRSQPILISTMQMTLVQRCAWFAN